MTASTSATTGALIVSGGIGVGRNVNVGGNITCTTANCDNVNCGVLTATQTQTNFLYPISPINVVSVQAPLTISGNVNTTNITTTLDNNRSGVGACFSAKKMAIATNILGPNYNLITQTGDTVIAYDTSLNTGFCIAPWGTPTGGSVYNGIRMDYNGNVGINKSSPTYTLDVSGSIAASGIARITNTTASTSYTTGAMVVSGGVGVNGDVYISGNLNAGNLIGTLSSTNPITSNSKLKITGTGVYCDANNQYCHFYGTTPTALQILNTFGMNKGTAIGWNYTSGVGMTDFVNLCEGGSGGFKFWKSGSSQYNLTYLAYLDGGGNFNTAGSINATGNISGNNITAANLISTDNIVLDGSVDTTGKWNGLTTPNDVFMGTKTTYSNSVIIGAGLSTAGTYPNTGIVLDRNGNMGINRRPTYGFDASVNTFRIGSDANAAIFVPSPQIIYNKNPSIGWTVIQNPNTSPPSTINNIYQLQTTTIASMYIPTCTVPGTLTLNCPFSFDCSGTATQTIGIQLGSNNFSLPIAIEVRKDGVFYSSQSIYLTDTTAPSQKSPQYYTFVAGSSYGWNFRIEQFIQTIQYSFSPQVGAVNSTYTVYAKFYGTVFDQGAFTDWKLSYIYNTTQSGKTLTGLIGFTGPQGYNASTFRYVPTGIIYTPNYDVVATSTYNLHINQVLCNSVSYKPMVISKTQNLSNPPSSLYFVPYLASAVTFSLPVPTLDGLNIIFRSVSNKTGGATATISCYSGIFSNVLTTSNATLAPFTTLKLVSYNYYWYII